jgi:hypothetical protein
VLKQGGVIQAYSNHRDNRGTLGLPFARHVFDSFVHPIIQGDLEFMNISKRKEDADSPEL